MPKLTYDVSILAQLFNFVYMCVFIDHLECPFEWRIVSPMIRQYYNFPSTATCAVLMLSTLSPMDCAPPQVGCTVDIGWLVCGVAWCHPVCVGLYTVVAVVLTVCGSYSSLYSVYFHLHPVLSLLSARGTILKSTLFFLYSFLSCLFVDIGWSVCGVAWCHPVSVGFYCCHRGVDCTWVLQFSIPSILISTLFFLYSFLPEALFSNLPCSFSTPFCQRHYSQIYPVLSLLLSVLSVPYARGTILNSTLFFLYSFLSCLFPMPEALFSTLPCSLLLCGCFCIGCLVCSSFMRGNSPIAIPRTHKE